MIRATQVIAKQGWQGAPADTLVLNSAQRQPAAQTYSSVRGLDIQRGDDGAFLRNGDALLLEDGRLVEVIAAAEALSEIRAQDSGHVAHLAWVLGSFGKKIEILGNKIRFPRDEAAEAKLRAQGIKIVWIEAPFEPMGETYIPAPVAAAPKAHDHGHHHDHAGCCGGHGHDHGSDHKHDHHDHKHGHEHHDGCCGGHHDHGHEHK